MRKLGFLMAGLALAGLVWFLVVRDNGGHGNREDASVAGGNGERASGADPEPGQPAGPSAPKGHVAVVTEDWKPYSFEEDGAVKGSATGLVRKVLERAGIDYSIKVYPWARAYSMALNDDDTLIFAIVRSGEREPLFNWVGQVAPTDSCSFYITKRQGRHLR